MEEILKNILKLKNFKDITTYAENVINDYKSKNQKPQMADAFEAMNLYNMYVEAMDFEDYEGYLYPFKLLKVLEITNSFSDVPQFVSNKGLYVFRGEIKVNELDSILSVLIKYANITLILKIMQAVLPIIESLPILESIYVAIGIMKLRRLELPAKIGQYYTAEYINKCSEMPFYQSARLSLKKIISLSQLPKKAASMYFSLPDLYDALCESAIFDFGIIATQCFKIIEITSHEILNKIFAGKESEEIFDLLPSNLQDLYKREKFKLDYLEIGKIYYLLNDALEGNLPIDTMIKEYFKDKEILELYISYITPGNIAKYRNAPAHGEYITQEVADEAVKLLDSFINSALYRINQK